MDEKITIIEGPPPTFEDVNDGWVTGLLESASLSDIVVTRLRTFNGPALVERCHRAWRDQSTMFLHYRNDLGLEETAPILAARTVDTGDGQVLLLWIRREPGEDDETPEEDDDDSNALN